MKNKQKIQSEKVKVITNVDNEQNKDFLATILGNFMATEVIKSRVLGLNTCLRGAIKLN